MSSSSPASDLRPPTSSSHGDSEVLVRVENVSKIFCRDFKKSLLYGLKDSARDLMAWGKRSEIRDQRSKIGSQRSDPSVTSLSSLTSDLRLPTSSSPPTSDLRPLTSSSSLTSGLRSPTSGSRPLRPGEFLAVDNVSFELRRSECLGLIGRNGAGKTTLLKLLNGLIKPDSDRIEIRSGSERYRARSGNQIHLLH